MKKFLALGLSCCMLAGFSTSAAAAEKTELNVVAEFLNDTLEPATNWNSWGVVRLGVGETLVKFADDGSCIPWLAESWECAEDNLTWTFKLKDGIKFSNGADMTATKVVQSIERLFELEDPENGGTGNPQGHMTYSSITANDEEGTVTIVTETPTPDMPGCLAYPWTLIVDAEASEGYDPATESPICTGPYVVEEFVQGSNLSLVRNEHYWDGEVPFDKVNVTQVKESATRAMALQDGSADIAINIAALDLGLLESDDNIDISVVSGYRLGYAHINFEGVLGNDTLRKAVQMAIDGETIGTVTTNGTYQHGYPVLSPYVDYGYDTLTCDYQYDPEGAMALLDEAGIVDTDGDGYRELDGEMIEIDYKCTANRMMDKIGQAQAAQMEAIGIKCNFSITDQQADVMNNHLFDMVSSNEATMQTADPAKFFGHWATGRVDNYGLYSNEEYDEIYNKMLEEFDQDLRKEYCVQLQQILLDDAAVNVYGYFNFNLCSTKAVTGAYCPTSDFYWITKDIKPAE